MDHNMCDIIFESNTPTSPAATSSSLLSDSSIVKKHKHTDDNDNNDNNKKQKSEQQIIPPASEIISSSPLQPSTLLEVTLEEGTPTYNPTPIVNTMSSSAAAASSSSINKKSKLKNNDNKINAHMFIKNIIAASQMERIDLYEFSTNPEIPSKPIQLDIALELLWRHILIKTQDYKYLFLLSEMAQYIMMRPYFNSKVLSKDIKKQDIWMCLANNPSYIIKDTNSPDYMAENLIRCWDLTFQYKLPIIPQQFELPQIKYNTAPPQDYCMVPIVNNRILYLLVTQYHTFMIENGLVVPLNKTIENCTPFFLGFDLNVQENEYYILEVVSATNKLYIIDILNDKLGNYEDRLNHLSSRIKNKNNEVCSIVQNQTPSSGFLIYKHKTDVNAISYLVPNTPVGVIVGFDSQQAVLALLREEDSRVLEFFKLVSPTNFISTLMFRIDYTNTDGITHVRGVEHEVCDVPCEQTLNDAIVVTFDAKYEKIEPTYKPIINTTSEVEQVFKESKQEMTVEAIKEFMIKSKLPISTWVDILNEMK